MHQTRRNLGARDRNRTGDIQNHNLKTNEQTSSLFIKDPFFQAPVKSRAYRPNAKRIGLPAGGVQLVTWTAKARVPQAEQFGAAKAAVVLAVVSRSIPGTTPPA